jgi:catechol 2,3-dioxygenase-like lactoylglutathione lyase family enzyme
MTEPPVGLDHVGLTCADLERSLRFYRDTLGLPLRDRGVSEVLAAGETGSGYSWADFELGDGRVIELVEFAGPKPEPTGQDSRAPGASHFALRVKDIEATLARLAEDGFEPRTPPATVTEPGAWQGSTIAFVRDPDGQSIELVQPPSA